MIKIVLRKNVDKQLVFEVNGDTKKECSNRVLVVTVKAGARI